MTALDEFEGAYRHLLRAAQRVRRELRIGTIATESAHERVEVPETSPDLRLVQEVVASHYEIDVQTMVARLRFVEFARPRMVAMALCRRLTRRTIVQVGGAFARDHGTVSHAVKAMANACETDADFRDEFAVIEHRARAALRAAA